MKSKWTRGSWVCLSYENSWLKLFQQEENVKGTYTHSRRKGPEAKGWITAQNCICQIDWSLPWPPVLRGGRWSTKQQWNRFSWATTGCWEENAFKSIHIKGIEDDRWQIRGVDMSCHRPQPVGISCVPGRTIRCQTLQVKLEVLARATLTHCRQCGQEAKETCSSPSRFSVEQPLVGAGDSAGEGHCTAEGAPS